MELHEFFAAYPRCAVALSGGADSAFLLWAAGKYAAEARAYYVHTAFTPEKARERAVKLSELTGVPLRIVEVDVLSDEAIRRNDGLRCYHCKKVIFDAIERAAKADGFGVLLDGTNASDEESDRPGVRALREKGVLSPLRLCGLTKAQVRQMSKEAGLFTWDLPADACLATRIPTGTSLTPEDLGRVERGEEKLRQMGFSDLRLRLMGTAAKLQLRPEQLPLAVEKREAILDALAEDHTDILLDMHGRTGE